MTAGPPSRPDRAATRNRLALRRVAQLAATAALVVAAAAAAAVWWSTRPAAGEPPLNERATVTIVAGDGVADVRDGPASRARFSDPFGVAVGRDGTIYVADAGGAQRIRRVAPDGTVATLAGDGVPGHRDGPAASARFDTPSGLALDAAGGLLVADSGNHAIRRIGPDGIVTTVAGDGVAGYRDGPAAQARFHAPAGLAVDARGRIVVADTYNDRIRVISPDGTVGTIAGSGRPGWADGPPREAEFDTPAGVAIDPTGSIYVADRGNASIRRISSTAVDTVPLGGLVRPTSVALDGDGTIYAGGDDRVVRLPTDGEAVVIAGAAAGPTVGVTPRLRGVAGIALAGRGDVVVADGVNALIRRISLVSRPQPLLPGSPFVRPEFDAAAFALLPLLWPFSPPGGPFELTATFGEPRGGPDMPRLHAGIDVASAEGTMVHALRDGVVASLDSVSAFDTIYESIRIGPIGYVHLRVGRDRRGRLLDAHRFVPTVDEAGRLTRVRVPRGTRFSTGTPIGTLNSFNHAHLNIGWPGEEENPLQYRLPQLRDTHPPVIVASHLFAEDGTPLTARRRGRVLVDGRVEVVADAWDRVDGNLARRRLGVYSTAYQVLETDGSPAPGFPTPRQTLVFDRVPSNEAAALVFAPGSGIPGQGARTSRFLYRVTNTFRSGVATRGSWDTTALAPGDYIVRLSVSDIHGNTAARNRDIAVTIQRSAGTPVQPD